MKPSDILLIEPIPLTDTFKKAEREATAAMLIATLAANGDEWRPVAGGEVANHIRVLHERGELPSWVTNPFLPVDLAGLVADGALTGKHGSYAFTEQGLEQLRRSRWNQEAS